MDISVHSTITVKLGDNSYHLTKIDAWNLIRRLIEVAGIPPGLVQNTSDTASHSAAFTPVETNTVTVK